MATLYRKYRSQKFSEFFGQNHVKITLQNEIMADKVAHAYLFCGPRAVGKTSFARVLAKAINCLNRREGEFEPCNKCDACTEITGGRSLDVLEIDAASHTGVDNVRDNIIASTRVSPVRYKYKVFIIDEVHMLSISAFNALLKIIEEPPEFVVFILCTTEVHKVPATIISRCQRFDFRRISVNDIVGKLSHIVKKEEIKINKKILEAIARQSEGHMRDAESLLGQIVSIGGREITQEEADLVIPRSDTGEIINLINYIAKKDCAGAIGLINNLIDNGIDLKTFVTDLIEILRKIMLGKVSANLAANFSLEFGESLEIKINEASGDLSLARILEILEAFIAARIKIKDSFISQLPVEIALVELCAKSEIIPPAKAAIKTINNPLSSSPPSPSATGEEMPKDLVNSKWSEVLTKIKKYNHSLSLILRVCEPRELDNKCLTLAFKYKFHKDRVSEPKIRALVEKVLSEVYNNNLTLVSVIDENIEVNNGDKNGQPTSAGRVEPVGEEVSANNPDENAKSNGEVNMIDNLLKTFGGKIVK